MAAPAHDPPPDAPSDATPGRRDAVLGVLRASPAPLSIAEIAERLGIHANTARFHLESLERRGQVERAAPAQRVPGRPPLLFRAVPRMDPEGPRHYRLLAEALADSLTDSLTDSRSGAAAARERLVEAGRSWWRRSRSRFADVRRPGSRQSVDDLVTVLDELGFAAESLDGDSPRIGLRSCPFLELATSRPEVVCPVHLGLMLGALEEWESPLTVERLQPFAEPDLCVAHLAAAADAR